ncbi:MAG: 2'-5' RNA ligase [Candidatus Wildermuthbacteria bacterium RIFCSPHIGHO2_02_FULL_47_12]|uniref:RNA 2',3'-cyclic phosphodiesterase n=2 Tax=Parcubacteria group TaxID=1794811 RepID=A0A1G2R3U8_9BACT|nr:MAG: 2'-5' RNA ligase [Candidatus Buchananbacteria bacterium RIFCSPLOWO2_01_FULL_46_12]OHA66741.1 MAG: 2'-5' RNA ligase [Candidatus Wildermuthbacteria bacterium RIFCSPHIGHO2_02_FULL_47_12]
MLHRIFLAINIPESFKEEMLAVRNTLPEIPCAWTSKENLHFTLVFLGNTSDKELEEVLLLAKKVGERHKKFSIPLSRIQYGSSRNVPRMIWATGHMPKELLALQKDLERTFSASTILYFTPEKRPYSLHLTLARLNGFELQTMEQDELPIIDEEISWEIPVNSFEVMESKLKRGGAEYSVIKSIPLKT